MGHGYSQLTLMYQTQTLLGVSRHADPVLAPSLAGVIMANQTWGTVGSI